MAGHLMVADRYSEDNRTRQFLIQPNCSAGWKATSWFFAFILGVTLIVNGYFVSLGAWLVMPFAVLEMLVLGVALYGFLKQANGRELITISDGELRIERLRWPGHKQTWDFQAYWVKVILRGNPATWHPSRLLLRSHGQEVLVGECLTETERRRLAKDLSDCVAVFR